VYERLGRFLLRHRVAVLVAVILSTAYFAYQIKYVWQESPTIDQFPKNHPYVETFIKYANVFGGASRVVIQLEVKEGDIFNVKTLEKIKTITKQLELVPGVNNYQVLSIAQKKVKETKIDAEKGIRSASVMWPDVPKTQAEIDDLKKRIYTNRRVFGSLVSIDSKAALIVGGFFEKQANPKDIYQRVEKIVNPERDANTSIEVIGRPIMLGFILENFPKLIWIFGATIISTIIVLFLYFRHLHGMLVPLLTAAFTAIWGLGFLGLIRCNFDPLVIVVPFIISARALSHSVQLVDRYIEEYARFHDKIEAAVASFDGLFVPGMLGIIVDAVAVYLVWITPIPIMQKLAIMGGFWVLSIIVSNVIFNPVLLSFLPPPNIEKVLHQNIVDRALTKLSTWVLGPQRWVILGVTIAIFGVGYFFARDLKIGDVHPGTPMLWPDSKYNKDTERIAEKFRNTEELTVVVEGETHEAIKNPKVLYAMEDFQRYMEGIPEVGATSSFADLLPGLISLFHGNDPRWELIPDDKNECGFFMEMVFQQAEPGDLVRFLTIGSQNANITLYLQNHKGEVLRKVVARAKEYIDSHPVEGVKFRLAGGYGGLLAAINEVIVKYEVYITVLAFSFIFFCCAIAYRSLLAGILFIIPLIGSNYLTYALMAGRKIGLDVNTLPVVSLGVGLGVDYGLYIIGRMKEEIKRGRNMAQSVLIAMTHSGKAVLFTAFTMVLGIVFWAFSFLRFQADMGFLLVFWMSISMLGGLILLPSLVVTIKPKFVFGPKAKAGKSESVSS
jgi:predicted RND superfamily exporter protein